MTPDRLEAEVVALREQLQVCQSTQRRAHVTATDLRSRFLRLMGLIPIREMATTNAVLQQIELLIAQLAPNGGAA